MRHAAHKKFERKITVSEIPWPRIAANIPVSAHSINLPGKNEIAIAAKREGPFAAEGQGGRGKDMRIGFKCLSGLVAVLAAFGIAFMAPSAQAADVPMRLYGKVTPSNVYRLGTALKHFAREIVEKTADKKTQKALLSLTQKKVSGKKPSDVVQVVYSLHDRVNALRKRKGLKRIGRYARQDGKVTPAIVYINAGLALDGLADIAQRIDSSKNYGDLYEAPTVNGKTRSDVFAIVDLSYRILTALTSKQGNASLN